MSHQMARSQNAVRQNREHDKKEWGETFENDPKTEVDSNKIKFPLALHEMQADSQQPCSSTGKYI